MDKELQKILTKTGIDLAGRLAGNYLLDSLTKEGSDPDTIAYDKKGNVADYRDLRMKSGQSDSEFRREAINLTPRFKREDIPEGFGAQTVLGGMVENPSQTAIYAKAIAPFAGMAAAGTALNYIFGGKPSSEYKVPVGNQNVLAANTKARNEESLERMKYQHAIDLERQKAKTREYQNNADFRRKQMAAEFDFERKQAAQAASVASPAQNYLDILQAEALDRQGMLGIEKDIARSIFGTGVRL